MSHGSSAGWVGRLKGVKAQCHHYRCFSKLNFLFIYREKPRKKLQMCLNHKTETRAADTVD